MCLPLSAQLVVNMKPEKDQFVAHEEVNLVLTITNRAGKTLTLRGHKRQNWLDITKKETSSPFAPMLLPLNQ